MSIPGGDSDHTSLLGVAILGLLGSLLVGVAIFNGYESVIRHDSSVAVAALENVIPVALNLGLLGTAVWLFRHDDGIYAPEIVKWTGMILAVLLVVTGWVYFFQQRSGFHPFFIYTDVVTICALSGVAIGAYNTRRKQRAQALQTQRSRFFAVFNNVPDPTIGVDTTGEEGTVAMVNPAFEELFDLDPNEIQGKPLTALTTDQTFEGDSELPQTPTDSEWGAQKVVMELGQERRTFLELDAPGGDHADFQDRYDVYIDVTPRRRRQERLAVLSRTLRHDIRNKMTVVKGNAETLQKNPDHPVRERLASRIHSAADHILMLSERVYDLEHSLGTSSQRTETDLIELLTEAIEDVEQDYPDCSFDLNAPATVRVTAVEALPKALRELIENAAKHNDAETPQVWVHVNEMDDEHVTLRISDNGKGIPEQARGVIAGDLDRSQLNHLDGLGLWFANWVVRDSGGRFDLHDRDPRGTIVEMTLPRISAD